MQKFLKTLLLTASLMGCSVAAANAATVNLKIYNTSKKAINVDAIPGCTNCTTSTTTSIRAEGVGTTYATANPGATTMTYSIDYSNYFGPSFIERGCRAEIVVELNAAGAATDILSFEWDDYIGSATCTTLDLNIVGGTVDWKVEFYAPNT